MKEFWVEMKKSKENREKFSEEIQFPYPPPKKNKKTKRIKKWIFHKKKPSTFLSKIVTQTCPRA